MALKFTVHGVQSFIKGHRKSGVISIKHSRDNIITNRISPLRFLPVTVGIYVHVCNVIIGSEGVARCYYVLVEPAKMITSLASPPLSGYTCPMLGRGREGTIAIVEPAKTSLPY